MHLRFARWTSFAALWLAVGLVLATEVYFNLRVTQPDVSFVAVAIPQFARVAVWAALTPLVLALRRRVPLARGRWVGGVGFHLALSFLVMAGYYLARIAFLISREGEPWAEFWVVARSSFFGRNLIDMGFYWAVIACGYSFELYRRYKNEQIKAAQLESELREAELRSLKQQLQPHFLFNTMNTISVLVREGRNEEAVSLLAKLSALLRAALDGGREQEITLRQELEFIERYTEIQRMRFADRLTVEMRVAAPALDMRIPNLLLQPIVENAILHGIVPKQGPGRVEISGDVEDGSLRLTVTDDGVGFATDPGSAPREGIGISNTRQRLARLYGRQGHLVLRTSPGRGTTVAITLPGRA